MEPGGSPGAGAESSPATLGARTTIGRLIEPREIADVIVFCVEHPVVNGAVLHANLGQIES